MKYLVRINHGLVTTICISLEANAGSSRMVLCGLVYEYGEQSSSSIMYAL